MNFFAKLNRLQYLPLTLKNLYKMLRITGFWGVITKKPLLKPLFFVLEKLGLKLNKKHVKLHIKGYINPVFFRYGSSDPDVFTQIFLFEEYSCIKDLKEPKVIIDCGANVGYSSIYFLNKYPNASVIAIEPDPENFKVCEKNLSYYDERVSLINSAIWSQKTGLIISKAENWGNAYEWAMQVKECKEGQEPDIYAISIDDLLEDYGLSSIDLLKVDIEGSEAEIFAKNYENWLNKVKNIVIELHSEECEKEFFKALSMYDYELSRFGELTICKKISLKASSETSVT
jgi:FkbM family methyltransferase